MNVVFVPVSQSGYMIAQTQLAMHGCSVPQMRFLLLFSRQGKLRLQKWFTPLPERERRKIVRDMTMMVLARSPRCCSVIHWRDLKIVYKR